MMAAHFKWEEQVDPETETLLGRLMFTCEAQRLAVGGLLNEHSTLEDVAVCLESMAKLLREAHEKEQGS